MPNTTHPKRFDFDDAAGTLPDDLALQTLVMVNIAFVGAMGSKDWVLVDAGLPGMAGRIADFAEARFGDSPPRAIVLTHGHFDHVGSLHALLELWPDVEVYAHALEMPYLTGKSSYPPPDPTVGGGLMARLSPLYPKGPYDFGDRVRALPTDGTVPPLPGWEAIPTPGHSPGHVSLFRERDGALIVGDAFVTQKQESLVGVMTAAPDLRGPPTYFTPDWESARDSVRRLAALRPRSAITGHGHALSGPDVPAMIAALAEQFDERSVPARGRYVGAPARTDENGIVSVPPKPFDPVPLLAAAGGMIVLGVAAFLIADRAQCAARDQAKRAGLQIDECD